MALCTISFTSIMLMYKVVKLKLSRWSLIFDLSIAKNKIVFYFFFNNEIIVGMISILSYFQDLSEAMVLDKDGQPKWRSWPNILPPTSMDRSQHLQHPILQQQSPPIIWGKYKYFLRQRRYISWKSYDEKFISWRQTRERKGMQDSEILIIIEESSQENYFFLVKKKSKK